MQKWKLACIVLMLCAVGRVSAQQESYQQRALRYIEEFKALAIAEQKRSGVPAAIKLAQGIHETSAGASELAVNAKNHFGIKCKKEWTGQKYAYTDDAPNECFRKYDDPVQSYRDHSDYLRTNKRYASLFELAEMDYKGWATGLKRAGYATNPKYAQIIIKIVEDYHLQDYTIAALDPTLKTGDLYAKVEQKTEKRPSEVVPEVDMPVAPPVTAVAPVAAAVPVANAATPGGKKNKIGVSYGVQPGEEPKMPELLSENPVTPVYDEVVRVNDLKAFYARKGTMLLNDAIKHNIRYAKLLELNDLPDAPLEADMYIYLEKKHTTGNTTTHTVQEGETLTQIAQKEGMQLKYLKAYNKIGGNEEPVPGAVLQLLDYVAVKPATRPKASAPKPAAPVAIASTAKAANYISKKELEQGDTPPIPVVATVPVPTPAVATLPVVSEPVIEPTPETRVEEVVAAKEEIVEEVKDGPEAASEARNDTVEAEVLVVATADSMRVAAEAEVVKPEAEKVEITDVPLVYMEPLPVQKSDTTEVVVAKAEVVEEILPEDTKAVDEVVATPVASVADSVAVVAEKTFNIAQEPAVEEQKIVAAPEEEQKALVAPVAEEAKKEVAEPVKTEPEDEFSRLKAKLDKVVYSSDHIASNAAEEQKPATVAEKEITEAATTDLKKYYTVKKGDTAFGIAKKHKISMKQLMEWNKLDFGAIKAGQQLRVKP